MTTAQDVGKVVSLTYRPPLPQEIHLLHISVRGCVDPQGKSAARSIMSLKTFDDTIWSPTSDLPVCSVVP